MRILFLLTHTERAAGARYRVYQFLPFFRAAGIQCDVAAFVNPELYEILYSSEKPLRRAWLIAKRTAKRLGDMRRLADYDGFFVYRECYPFGPPLVERRLRATGKPIVYDFDDAIFLPERSWSRQLLRRPDKTEEIVRLSSRVIVSNQHLRGYCNAFNANVDIVPTSVDTALLGPRPQPLAGRRIRLGWVGSHSTARYLELLREPLRELSRQRDFELVVVGAGKRLEFPGVQLTQRDWSLETEVADFQSLDIGLYPLASSVWELGKAGFKAIQYLAVGTPCVVSPVGVTAQIVRDGVDGFWAASPEQWVERLTRLIDDAALRARMGASGRALVEAAYSLDANAPRLVELVGQAVATRG